MANLMEGIKVNFVQLIIDELFVRDYKTSSALPFSCLIIELCRLANLLIINGVNNELKATKSEDIKRHEMTSRLN